MASTVERVGTRKFVLLVAILIAVAGAFAFFRQIGTSQTSTSSSPTVTTSSGIQLAEPVRNAVNGLFRDFNNRDVISVMKNYDFSADIVWDGNAGGLAGAYAGVGNIQLLYGSTLGKTTELTATINNYAEKVFSPSDVNVTLTLEVRGNSTTLGVFNGTINVVQNWVYSGGQWVITREHWNYKAFDIEFPASTTTFPQWGALRAGKSPNLVSEKSFEWSAGPVLAAASYAFLLSIVAIAVQKYRSKLKKT